VSIFKAFKKLVTVKSKIKKLDYFYSLCDKSSNVLDVGIAYNKHSSDLVNLFLNTFRLASKQYTGLAVASMDALKRKHPDKKFVEYPGGVFPFKDKEFDWVFSNAVVEHVGNHDDQLLFINEMMRTGKNVFFTTPNKYFPVDSHTNAFFRHWFNESFYEWCKVNNPYWTKDNLVLLSYKELRNLMEVSNAEKYIIQQNRFLGYPMTFTVVCSGLQKTLT
jgi:hypothetical protein